MPDAAWNTLAHAEIGLGEVAAAPPPAVARSAALFCRDAKACRKAAEGVGEAGPSSTMSFALDPANAIDPSIEVGRAIEAATSGMGGGTVTTVLLIVVETNEARDRLRLCRELPASEPSQDRLVVGLGARLGTAAGGASVDSSSCRIGLSWTGLRMLGSCGAGGAGAGEGVRAVRFGSGAARVCGGGGA